MVGRAWERAGRGLQDGVTSPSFVRAAISFPLIRILCVVGLMALSRGSSIQPISFASFILGFTPLLMTFHLSLNNNETNHRGVTWTCRIAEVSRVAFVKHSW